MSPTSKNSYPLDLLILGGDPNAQLIICIFVFLHGQMFVAMEDAN